jgi:glycosyl-4,4'-diaponeurosporenoate acyltransferase
MFWIVGLNVLAWVCIQIGLAWSFTRVAAERFDPNHPLARPRLWERNGRVYERFLRIRLWKDKLPDGASWFAGGLPKASLRSRAPEYLRSFTRETWRGELVHWLAMFTLPLFCVWNPWWAVLVNGLYAVTANLPCVLVQRYNRLRICRSLRRRGAISYAR